MTVYPGGQTSNPIINFVEFDSGSSCFDLDPCVGEYDECGVCAGPGAIYECGCSGPEEGFCDCDGNMLDALGVCGGSCEADVDMDGVCDVDEIPGCDDAGRATTTRPPRTMTVRASTPSSTTTARAHA